MIPSIIIFALTVVCLTISIIIKPSIKIGKIKIQTFWIITFFGAILIIIFNKIKLFELKEMITKNSGMNPLQILSLFISMSILSIALDEVGFFKMCAYFATKKIKKNQIALFLSLALIISVLTIFTSNDIIILTFTPFICYFSKHAKINPIPYLVSEFIFANTWSMLFVIGNPTNIFLANSFNIGFIEYLNIMALPTLVGGIVSLTILLLIFRKDLQKKFSYNNDITIDKIDRFTTLVCFFHLLLCTILLIISQYINIEMWLIAVITAISLTITLIFLYIIRKNKLLFNVYRRVPWSLIPFVISMYIIVFALDKNGVIDLIGKMFSGLCITREKTIYFYGIISYLSCNILNNIPMSVMFEKIIMASNITFMKESVYSCIIASNIGAYLTPIGALAGIMWMSILRNLQVKFNFLDFVKYGLMISVVVLVSALTMLIFVI